MSRAGDEWCRPARMFLTGKALDTDSRFLYPGWYPGIGMAEESAMGIQRADKYMLGFLAEACHMPSLLEYEERQPEPKIRFRHYIKDDSDYEIFKSGDRRRFFALLEKKPYCLTRIVAVRMCLRAQPEAAVALLQAARRRPPANLFSIECSVFSVHPGLKDAAAALSPVVFLLKDFGSIYQNYPYAETFLLYSQIVGNQLCLRAYGEIKQALTLQARYRDLPEPSVAQVLCHYMTSDPYVSYFNHAVLCKFLRGGLAALHDRLLYPKCSLYDVAAAMSTKHSPPTPNCTDEEKINHYLPGAYGLIRELYARGEEHKIPFVPLFQF